MVKNLLAVQETRVQSLGWKDTLEKGMATHSSILGLENPTDRGAWQAAVTGSQRIGHDSATNTLIVFMTFTVTIMKSIWILIFLIIPLSDFYFFNLINLFSLLYNIVLVLPYIDLNPPLSDFWNQEYNILIKFIRNCPPFPNFWNFGMT